MQELAVPAAQLVDLPLASIRPSATNPRKSVDAAALTDLMQSISSSGLAQPVLVRPLFDPLEGAGVYELVVGSRRFAAFQQLGRETIPATVREMSDDEVLDVQIAENLQRADIDPLEEAEAFSGALARMGSIAEVASRLGKEQAYVAKSLRLTALTLHARDALRGRLITIEHAMLLARLADAEQNAALKWTLDHSAGVKVQLETLVSERLARREQEEKDRGLSSRFMRYTWEPQTVVRLKAWIEAESGILLSRAPWSLTDDALLPGVGPCATCAKNTQANSPLFGDLQMGEATCTDGAQFAAKTAAFVQIAMVKAGHDEAAKVTVPRLSWKYSSVKPSVVPNDVNAAGAASSTANPAKLLKKSQWVEAKAGSCPNVRTGITADWSDDGERGYMGDGKKLRKPGEPLRVCIAAGCKVHPKDWEQPKSAGPQQERHDPAAAKREEERREHLVKIEREIRSKILYAVLGKLNATTAIMLALEKTYNGAEYRKRLAEAMPELDALTLDAFAIFCSMNEGNVRVNGYWLTQPGGVAKDRKDIFELAKGFSVDGAQVAAQYFHEAGGIAPDSDPLYPKGIPWPKGMQSVEAASAKSKTKSAAKPGAETKGPGRKTAVKKAGGKIRTLTPAQRKNIADAMKKRWSAAKKQSAKKAVKR